MPFYNFLDPEGNVVQEFFKMADAPDLGAKVKIDGVECTRIVSQVNGFVPAADQVRVSNAAGRWTPGFEHDPKGRPLIKNAHDERELCKRLSEDGHQAVPAREVDFGPPPTEYAAKIKKQADKLIGQKQPKSKKRKP